jgi:hypothetical protein
MELSTAETFAVYGRPSVVTSKLANYNLDLASRRVFVVIQQTEGNSEVMFYEKAKQGFDVWQLQGDAAEKFTNVLDKTIMSNRGINCVGEQAKAQLRLLGGKDMKPLGRTSDPASAIAVTNHLLKPLKDDAFVHLTIVCLC